MRGGVHGNADVTSRGIDRGRSGYRRQLSGSEDNLDRLH
jgi:hypothetical protein